MLIELCSPLIHHHETVFNDDHVPEREKHVETKGQKIIAASKES